MERRTRLTDVEFLAWCQQLHLSTATCDHLARMRAAPPGRHVQGRGHNVCGTYPSRKMGVTIQFESHTLELSAIYLMEGCVARTRHRMRRVWKSASCSV